MLSKPEAFFAHVRAHLFGGEISQPQVNGINAILDAWDRYGDGDDRKLAYILATAHHETAQFKYMREIWGPTKAQKGYEGRADLGNTLAGDGKKFAGRGFVQLTGRRNYADWSKRLGLDLVKEPSLVESYPVAARILVEGMMLGTFTGKKLGDYVDNHTMLLSMPPQPKADFIEARRVVNGTDKAAAIAGYAKQFLAALSLAPTASPAPAAPHSGTTPVSTDTTKGRGLTGWLILAAVVAAALVIAAFTIKF